MENSTQIIEIITNTINSIFNNLFSSIDNNLYSILDDITFINSDILNDNNFSKIFGTSSSNGILLIANSLLLAILIYYSSKYLLSHLTYSSIETPFSFIIKLIIFGICMNFSYFMIQYFLDINYTLTLSIRKIGENLFNKNICFSELITNINSKIYIGDSSINFFTIDGIIKSTLTMSLLSLIFSYSLRYITIKIFVLISPFAFLSLSMNSTSWFFKTWLRNLFSLLFIQIIVSLVLLILFSMDFSSTNLLNKYIYIGAIYFLIRVNFFKK